MQAPHNKINQKESFPFTKKKTASLLLIISLLCSAFFAAGISYAQSGIGNQNYPTAYNSGGPSGGYDYLIFTFTNNTGTYYAAKDSFGRIIDAWTSTNSGTTANAVFDQINSYNDGQIRTVKCVGGPFYVQDTATDFWRIKNNTILDGGGSTFQVLSGTGKFLYIGAVGLEEYMLSMNITVRNCHFINTNIATGVGGPSFSGYNTSAVNIVIEDNVYDCFGRGAAAVEYVGASNPNCYYDNIVFRNNKVYNSSVAFQLYGSDAGIPDIKFSNITLCGNYVEGGTGATYSYGFRVYGQTVGISVTGLKICDNTLIGCGNDGQSDPAIYLVSTASRQIVNPEIKNNRILDSPNNGLYLIGVDGATVKDNIFNGTVRSHIVAQYRNTNLDISENRFSKISAVLPAIDADIDCSCTGLFIHDNYFINDGSTGRNWLKTNTTSTVTATNNYITYPTKLVLSTEARYEGNLPIPFNETQRVALSSGATNITIALSTAFQTAINGTSYSTWVPYVSPSWETTWSIQSQSTTSYTVTFGTAPSDDNQYIYPRILSRL